MTDGERIDPGFRCGRCGRALAPGRCYRFAPAAGEALQLCLTCAFCHPPVLRRALTTALVVGTILTAINQGDAIVTMTLTPVLLWKIPLTYFVPFAVSTYSALGISREQTRPEQTSR